MAPKWIWMPIYAPPTGSERANRLKDAATEVLERWEGSPFLTSEQRRGLQTVVTLTGQISHALDSLDDETLATDIAIGLLEQLESVSPIRSTPRNRSGHDLLFLLAEGISLVTELGIALLKAQKAATKAERAERRRHAFNGVTHNLTLSLRLTGTGVRLLPKRHRTRYREEWTAELQLLQQENQALLGIAIRIVWNTPQLTLSLYARAWRSSRHGWQDWVDPLLKGVLAGCMTFLAAAAGMWTRSAPPTKLQIGLALAASVMAGVLTVWQSRRKRRDT